MYVQDRLYIILMISEDMKSTNYMKDQGFSSVPIICGGDCESCVQHPVQPSEPQTEIGHL